MTADTRSSNRLRVRATRGSLTALGLLAALATVAGARASWARPGGEASPPRLEPRFAGEFGLYVGLLDDGLVVRWITESPVPGVLRAFVDGEEVEEIRTTAGQVHAARLDGSYPVVTLAYGELDGDQYRTTIYEDPPELAPIDIRGVDSVYMFGDVHGEFDRVTKLLRNADLVDDSLAWTGGARRLVFLGDLFDRGEDVTRVLWFLYRLEREARDAGGAVDVILGNHELMIMSHDARYVGIKETRLASAHGLAYGDLFHPRTSVLGRWLATKPGLVRMDDLLLAHGGVGPEYADYTLEEYRDTLQAFIAEDLLVHWQDPEFLEAFADTTTLDSAGVSRRWRFFFGSGSVMWFRGLVLSDTLGPYLEEVLERFDASVHVVGHTPVATIQERYDGKLIAADLEEAASEMLFMARREEGGWDRYRIPLSGEWTPLSDLGPAATPER
jgi:hypothetical protein